MGAFLRSEGTFARGEEYNGRAFLDKGTICCSRRKKTWQRIAVKCERWDDGEPVKVGGKKKDWSNKQRKNNLCPGSVAIMVREKVDQAKSRLTTTGGGENVGRMRFKGSPAAAGTTS